MIENVIHWIVGFIISVAPPGVQNTVPKYKVNEPAYVTSSRETAEEALSRYNSIAEDLVEVVFDKQSQPLFTGPDARSHTAAIMLAVMRHESGGFRKDVDFAIGPKSRGDHGASWCLMQVKVGNGRTQDWNIVQNREPKWGDPAEELSKGFLGIELVKDRQVCFRESYKILARSFKAGTKLQDKLRLYASGSFTKGGAASRNRISTAEWFWNKSKGERTWNDDDIVRELGEKKVEKKRIIDLNKMNVALKDIKALRVESKLAVRSKNGFVGISTYD